MKLLWIWRKEIVYLILFIIIAAVLSYFIGHFMQILIFVLSGTVIYQALLVSKLELWLRGGAAVGKIPVAHGVWSDIYYHFFRIKKAEKERKKALGRIINKFRKSTDVLPDAAIVVGLNDEIEWSNKLAKRVLGIKKSDKGQRIDNLIRSPEFALFLKNNVKNPSFLMVSPVDAHIILQFKMVEYDISQRLIIAQDVTQQRNIEVMRKNFVDNVSHELRTPLTVLKGYLETLGDMDDGHSAILSRSIEQMNGQTQRMETLVDDLLLLARLETKRNKSKCVNVAELIGHICLDSNVIGGNKNRVHLSIESTVGLLGVEDDLRSAFSNLIINALKYSEENKEVHVIWKKQSGQMVFDVIDLGEGISVNEIPKITERFYRVDVKRTKKMNGTGLGLAIVKHVLLGHQAKLEISSKLGKGSRFRCVFRSSRMC